MNDFRHWMTLCEALDHSPEWTDLTTSLIEGVRPGMLYHATSIDNLYEILDGDEIKPNTGFPITHTGGETRSKHWGFRPTDVTANGYLKGVSLTRNMLFARAWKPMGAVLVLDGDLVRRDFRMVPVSFWGGRRPITPESEELVIGTIKALTRYLMHVEINQKVEDLYHVTEMTRFTTIKPTIKIVGREWRGTGLDKGTIVK